MNLLPENNPRYVKPSNPNYLRRMINHDYNRPSRYMITLSKEANTPELSAIIGNLISAAGSPDAPDSVLSASGRIIEDAIPVWLQKYPQIELGEYVVMPDHVHLCVNVKDYLKAGLSRAVANLMGMASRRRYDRIPEEYRPEKMPSFFSKGFNDRIAFTNDQWERQNWYVRDNPRRYLIKRANPDLFYATWIINLDGEEYMAKGNILLLRNPDLQVVRFSRRFSDGQFDAYLKSWDRCVENGGVLISPFIHPKEKAVREKALRNFGSIIRICENGFGERFAPQGNEFEYMGSNRLLLIAPMIHNSQKEEMRYSKAQQMNRLAERIAAYDWKSGAPRFRRMR